MAFNENRNALGEMFKATAKFGKLKEMCFMFYKGYTYMHLTDAKQCYAEGKFDFKKIKSLSFNKDEMVELRRLLPEFERYDALFRANQLSEMKVPSSPPQQSWYQLSTQQKTQQQPQQQSQQQQLQQQSQQQSQHVQPQEPQQILIASTEGNESSAWIQQVVPAELTGDEEIFFAVPDEILSKSGQEKCLFVIYTGGLNDC